MRILSMLILLLSTTTLALSQQHEIDSTSFKHAIESLFGNEKLNIGLVAQAGFEIRDNGVNTDWKLYYNEARFYVTGRFGSHFSYYSEITTRSDDDLNTIQLYLTYSPTRYLCLDLGRFKAPISKEYLRDPDELTFIRRSHAGLIMDLPRRRDGIRARANLFDNDFSISLAAFGKGYPSRITVAATRMSVVPWNTLRAFEGVRCEVGGSFIYDGPYSWESDDIRLWAADLYVQYDRVWMEGESVWRFTPGADGAITLTGSAGMYLSGEVEVAGRFDYYAEVDRTLHLLNRYSTEPWRSYTLGMNWIPEEGVKLQLNYVREEYYSSHGLLLNLQYAFNRD